MIHSEGLATTRVQGDARKTGISLNYSAPGYHLHQDEFFPDTMGNFSLRVLRCNLGISTTARAQYSGFFLLPLYNKHFPSINTPPNHQQCLQLFRTAATPGTNRTLTASQPTLRTRQRTADTPRQFSIIARKYLYIRADSKERQDKLPGQTLNNTSPRSR